MAGYKIGSKKGQDIANNMKAGSTYKASDGSTWKKNSDGSVSVTTKNGGFTANAYQSQSKNTSTNVKKSSGSKSSSSNRYSTTVYDKAGNAQGGYIENGLTFLNNGARLPDGYSSIDAQGRKWTMQNGQGVLVPGGSGSSRITNKGKYQYSGEGIDAVMKAAEAALNSQLGYDPDLDYGTALDYSFASGMGSDQMRNLYQGYLNKTYESPYTKYDDSERRAKYEKYIANAQELEAYTKYMEDMENYKSQYDDDIQEVLSSLRNREAFSYNPLEDDLYNIYAGEYGRLGDAAMNDTLAEYAAMTGGMPSSYAMSAAQQAKSRYDQELQNIIPTLQEAAYNRYQNDFNSSYQLLSALSDLDVGDYNRFSKRMSDGLSISQYLSELATNRYDNIVAGKASAEQNAIENALAQAKLDETMRHNQASESVSRGNLALSQQKFNQQQNDSDAVSYGYHCMVNGLDPETGEEVGLTGNAWVKKYGYLFTDSQFKDFMKYVNDDEEGLLL